jgi:hypothetical protein
MEFPYLYLYIVWQEELEHESNTFLFGKSTLSESSGEGAEKEQNHGNQQP